MKTVDRIAAPACSWPNGSNRSADIFAAPSVMGNDVRVVQREKGGSAAGWAENKEGNSSGLSCGQHLEFPLAKNSYEILARGSRTKQPIRENPCLGSRAGGLCDSGSFLFSWGDRNCRRPQFPGGDASQDAASTVGTREPSRLGGFGLRAKGPTPGATRRRSQSGQRSRGRIQTERTRRSRPVGRV